MYWLLSLIVHVHVHVNIHNIQGKICDIPPKASLPQDVSTTNEVSLFLMSQIPSEST